MKLAFLALLASISLMPSAFATVERIKCADATGKITFVDNWGGLSNALTVNGVTYELIYFESQSEWESFRKRNPKEIAHESSLPVTSQQKTLTEDDSDGFDVSTYEETLTLLTPKAGVPTSITLTCESHFSHH